MDKSEIDSLERVLEEFFNSAAGRRSKVNVTFEHKADRRGKLYVNTDIGFEGELLLLYESGFTIYTVGGVRPARFEDTQVVIDVQVPDPIPAEIT